MRPVEILAKLGTIVYANPGAPVTMSTSHCAQEIIEAIITALAPALGESSPVMSSANEAVRSAILRSASCLRSKILS